MRHSLITGALLHDIGKFIYRALQDKSVKKDHRHQELGAAWAKESGLPEEVVTMIQRHHSLRPDDAKYKELAVDAFQGPAGLHNDLHAVDIADNIASGMERQKDREGGSFKPDIPLSSIFDRISIKETGTVKTHYWPAVTLKEMPYPTGQDAATGYPKLWQRFKENFQALKETPGEEALLTLLQNYTFTMPEHTYVTDQPPDTSLYHHLKTTAAIAYCNYRYIVEEENLDWDGQDLSKPIRDLDKQKFLLVAADFSGIQDFVYTLSSKGALKTLRARSFYLNFLQESIATQLLDRFELPRSCVIYVGGGGFFLLAPNTQPVQQGLETFRDELNSAFFEQFGTAVYLALDSISLNGRDLSGEKDRLKEAWGEVKQKLDLQKSRKWENMLAAYEPLFTPKAPPDYQCSSCHVPIARPKETALEEAQCLFCQKMTQWSKDLGQMEAIYQVETDQPAERHLKFGHYYYCYRTAPQDRVRRTYVMKDFWNMAQKQPAVNFFQGTFYTESEFQKLVTRCIGVQRLGVLRMDVDFLGKVFSQGLKTPTFARLNDLSERLNLYFNYYLPALLQKKPQDPLLETPKETLDVNLVYSGGDDLLLVGTWDAALETAYQINHDFNRFTGNNDSLSLSGGLVIADEKLAFYKLAEMAGEAEDKAKNDGRDRLCLFDRTFPWTSIKNNGQVTVHHLLSLFLEGISWQGTQAKPNTFSRGFLQKLLFLSQTFRREQDMWIFPRLYYLFARTMRKDNEGFYKPLLAAIMQEKTFQEELIPALQIVDYLTRGGETRE